jgi:hypothetical protein
MAVVWLLTLAAIRLSRWSEGHSVTSQPQLRIDSPPPPTQAAQNFGGETHLSTPGCTVTIIGEVSDGLLRKSESSFPRDRPEGAVKVVDSLCTSVARDDDATAEQSAQGDGTMTAAVKERAAYARNPHATSLVLRVSLREPD